MSTEAMKDPRYRMLQAELRALNSRMGALLNQGMPKPFILDLKSISKASTFTDTEVECGGADLIQISTDGDMTDISYKVVHLDGSKSREMEAAESPHVIGPINALLITNDGAEAGRTVRIARNQGNPEALAAIKHGTPMSISAANRGRLFYAELLDYDGTLDHFETDQPSGTLPTLSFVGVPAVPHVKINDIKFQFTPTAAETYELFLLGAASEDDEQSESDRIFDSGAGMVGGTPYHQLPGGSPAKLPTVARLAEAGMIWVLIDWSGPPGDTTGYIIVLGETLA